MAKKKVYAVLRGVAPGIYRSWPEAEAQVKGFPGARYKGFADEGEARAWLASGGEEEGGGRKNGGRGNRVKGGGAKEGGAKGDATTPGKGEVVVHTDGGAIGNPGPGGYGIVIRSEEGTRELSAGFRRTTNNRMELLACITALRELRGWRGKIRLYSDSSYLVNGLSKGWAVKWRRNGWRKADGGAVLNRDLWEELLALSESLDVQFHWVRGHAGNPLNERCDRLAQGAARNGAHEVDRIYEQGTNV